MLCAIVLLVVARPVLSLMPQQDPAECRHVEGLLPDACYLVRPLDLVPNPNNPGPECELMRNGCVLEDNVWTARRKETTYDCSWADACCDAGSDLCFPDSTTFNDSMNGTLFTCDDTKPDCPTFTLTTTYYPCDEVLGSIYCGGCDTAPYWQTSLQLLYRTPFYDSMTGQMTEYYCNSDGGLIKKLPGGEMEVFDTCYDSNPSNPSFTSEWNCPDITTTEPPPLAAACRHTREYRAGVCYYQPNTGFDAFKYTCISGTMRFFKYSGGHCDTRMGATLVSQSDFTDSMNGLHFTCDTSKPQCPTRYFQQKYYTAKCRTLTDTSERTVVYDRCVYDGSEYVFYTCASEDVLYKYHSATSCVDAMGGSPVQYEKDTCYENQYQYDFDCITNTI